MARLRGDLEIVRHLLPPARAHSGEVGIIIIMGMAIVHTVSMKTGMMKKTKTLHEHQQPSTPPLKQKATPSSYASNRAVTTQPCVCW